MKIDYVIRNFFLKSTLIRITLGNLIVPNANYCKFEDWIKPIFDDMYREQIEKKLVWTPSKMISRLGEKINDPASIYYWAWKNHIPVFCPALTDGSLGDMLFFHSFSRPDFILDIVSGKKSDQVSDRKPFS